MKNFSHFFFWFPVAFDVETFSEDIIIYKEESRATKKNKKLA